MAVVLLGALKYKNIRMARFGHLPYLFSVPAPNTNKFWRIGQIHPFCSSHRLILLRAAQTEIPTNRWLRQWMNIRTVNGSELELN
jgi:hypothetical protein